MTDQQKLDFLRQILTSAGTIVTLLGWASADLVSQWIAIIMQVAGPAMAIVGLVWGYFANGKVGLVTAVANLPEVKKVTLEPDAPETPAINAATPNNVSTSS